jgi:methionyl-tRNA formyltransferase
MPIRTVFMGSPDFAVTILQKLNEHFPVCGIVTQPDRPAGRGREFTPPPVKEVGLKLGVPILQPEKLRNPESFQELQDLRPDLIVVAAFGQILRHNVLELPRFGCINVHGSYLPRWRGAAPIQNAILEGDETSGVTIIKLDSGIDTGPILSQKKVLLEVDETSTTLSMKLAHVGAELLVETLRGYIQGEITLKAQPLEGATYASMLNKEDGKLDVSQPALLFERKVRAFIEWPGTYIELDGQILKVRKVAISNNSIIQSGKRVVFEKYPAICTTDGLVILKEVQPPGKKWMDGAAYLNGIKNWQN